MNLSTPSIPADIILLICSYLPLRDLLVCKRVSHYLRDLLKNDLLSQYKLELRANGVPGHDDNLHIPVSERLDILRRYSTRLRHGQYSLDYTHHFQPQHQHTRLVWAVDGCVAHHVSYDDGTPSHLFIYAPPSILRGTPARCWTIPTPSNTGLSSSYAVDPSQDLLVTTGCAAGPGGSHIRIDLQMLGSPNVREWLGSAHPSATAAVLRTQPTTKQDMVPYSITDLRVHRQYLVWVTGSCGYLFPTDLEVWNWHTGQRVWSLSLSGYGIPGFTLLDNDHIAIAHNPRMHYRGKIDGVSDMQVHCFPSCPIRVAHPTAPSHLCTLGLPHGQHAWLRYCRMFSSAPSFALNESPLILSLFSNISYTTCVPGPVLNAQLDIAHRIAPSHRPPSTTMRLTHKISRAFANLTKTGRLAQYRHPLDVETDPEQPPPLVLPWADWGAGRCHVLKTAQSHTGHLTLTHGCRVPVLLDAPPRPGAVHNGQLFVFDFDSWAAHYAAPRHLATDISAEAESLSSDELPPSTVKVSGDLDYTDTNAFQARMARGESVPFALYPGPKELPFLNGRPPSDVILGPDSFTLLYNNFPDNGFQTYTLA